MSTDDKARPSEWAANLAHELWRTGGINADAEERIALAIDAARLDGIKAGLDAAAIEVILSLRSPIGHTTASALRGLDPAAIAKETP